MEPMTVGAAVLLATHLFATAAMAGLIWFVQLVHRALSDGYDAQVTRRLVRSNWIRTAGWSLRSAVAGAMIVAAAT